MPTALVTGVAGFIGSSLADVLVDRSYTVHGLDNCGDRISITELVKLINDVLGMDIDPIYDDPQLGDVRHLMADIEIAGKELGYEPEIGFQEGLRKATN